jgi:ABC-2 type transport system permease protein
MIRRMWMLTKTLLLVSLRDRTTIFWNFAFPLGLLIIYGMIWGDASFSAIDAVAWLTVGVAVLNMMSSGLMGDAAWLTNMRDQGILQRVRATPLPTIQLVGAYTLVRLILVSGQTAAIMALAMLGFGARFDPGGLALAGGVALFGATVFVSLGQALAAIAPSAGAAAAIGQAVSFPLMFLSNLFLPVDQLPNWLAEVSRWLPTAMLVDMLRPLLLPVPGAQAAWFNLIGLLLYGVGGVLIATRFFRWQPRA